MEIPMSRFTGFSEKSFFLKKIWNMGEVAVGCDAMAVNFHWLFHAGFREIRFSKRRDVINSNSWFLAILKGFQKVCLYSNHFCVYMHDSRAGFKILYAQQFFPVYCHVLFRVCTACMILFTVTYHNYLSVSL